MSIPCVYHTLTCQLPDWDEVVKDLLVCLSQCDSLSQTYNPILTAGSLIASDRKEGGGTVNTSRFVHGEPDCSAVLVWTVVTSPTHTNQKSTHNTNRYRKEGTKITEKSERDTDNETMVWNSFWIFTVGFRLRLSFISLMCMGSLHVKMYMKDVK
jgi:hypothetical protein